MDIANRIAELAKMDKNELVTHIVNGELNRFVRSYADYEKDDDDPHGHGKRIPYIGWYWREVDFASDEPYIPIGNCGNFIGFMENNKWDYPQRRLTPDEVSQVVAIVCEAHTLDNSGGILSEIIANASAKLDELWPLMQTFTIETSGYWIHGMQGQVGHAATEEDADLMIRALSDAAPGWQYWKVPV